MHAAKLASSREVIRAPEMSDAFEQDLTRLPDEAGDPQLDAGRDLARA